MVEYITEVIKDLAEQTEFAVRDERIPLDPKGIAEWFKQIADMEESGSNCIILPLEVFSKLAGGEKGLKES